MTAPEWLPRDVLADIPASEAERAAVRVAQRALRVESTGMLDPMTRAALRGLQRLCDLPVTGGLDGATAEAIEALWPFSWHEVGCDA